MSSGYPGEGQKMANYGFKSYTAQQITDNWKQNVAKENNISKTHSNKFTEMNPNSEAIESLSESINNNFFNTNLTHEKSMLYDCVHKFSPDYNPKHHRDDRNHNTKTLSISAEEAAKTVPSLSSSQYGKGNKLEETRREFSHVAHVRRDFYQHTQGIYLQHGISGTYSINNP